MRVILSEAKDSLCSVSQPYLELWKDGEKRALKQKRPDRSRGALFYVHHPITILSFCQVQNEENINPLDTRS